MKAPSESDRLWQLWKDNRDASLVCEDVGRHDSAEWFAREAESYRSQAEQLDRLRKSEGTAA